MFDFGAASTPAPAQTQQAPDLLGDLFGGSSQPTATPPQPQKAPDLLGDLRCKDATLNPSIRKHRIRTEQQLHPGAAAVPSQAGAEPLRGTYRPGLATGY